MAPVKVRGRSTTRVAPQEQWVEGQAFQFKKSPETEKVQCPTKTMRKRRQSQLLSRLDIAVNPLPSSPSSPAMRRTRRMSMASGLSSATSKIPRSASQQLPTANKRAKPPTATKMLAISTSRPKLPPSSKIPGVKSTSKINNASPETSPGVNQESWIEQINSPAMFYKTVAPNSPPLKGAQRRKSYTAATNVQVDMDPQGKKRSGDRSISPKAKRGRATSKANLARQKSAKTTTTSKSPSPVKRGRPKKVAATTPVSKTLNSTTTPVKSPPKSVRRSTRKTPSKVISKKSPTSIKKVSKLTLTKTAEIVPSTKINISSSNNHKIPVVQMNKINSDSTKVLKVSPLKSLVSVHTPSPVSTTSPTPLKRGTATRSLRRSKKVTITGASPVLTGQDYRRKTPKAADPASRLEVATLVAIKNHGATPMQLCRYLSHTKVAPSPLKRLVTGYRANPFTPRPEAQPSKLLKQTMKKKVTTEITTLKKVSAQLGSAFLVDPRVSLVRTPTRVMLRDAGFVSGNTPASTPNLPPTPTSANRHSRSARMVVSARRKISSVKEDFPCSSNTPVNSTPRDPCSPLFSSYTNGSSLANDSSPPMLGNSNGETPMTNGDSPSMAEVSTDCSVEESNVADFTESVLLEDDTEGVANGDSNATLIKGSSLQDKNDAATVTQEQLKDSKKHDKKGYCSLM